MRLAQDLGRKLGRLESDAASLAAVRRSALGSGAAAPPRFLVRVDEFPHYLAWDEPQRFGTARFRRFNEIMHGAGLAYLIAVLPRVSRAPLDPRAVGTRPLEDDELTMLATLREQGVAFALHGRDHRTRFASPRRHSELCGLDEAATAALLDRALTELESSAGLRPDVFVAPYNRFDEAQWAAARAALRCRRRVARNRSDISAFNVRLSGVTARSICPPMPRSMAARRTSSRQPSARSSRPPGCGRQSSCTGGGRRTPAGASSSSSAALIAPYAADWQELPRGRRAQPVSEAADDRRAALTRFARVARRARLADDPRRLRGGRARAARDVPAGRAVHVRLRPRPVAAADHRPPRPHLVPQPHPGRHAQLPQAAAADEPGVRVVRPFRLRPRAVQQPRERQERPHAGVGTLHVCYCHTPMRYAWEPQFLEGEDIGRVTKRLLPAAACVSAPQGSRGATRPDVFVANSANVAERIMRFYGREAEVVHPPVDVEHFLALPRAPEGFYLVLRPGRPLQAGRTSPCGVRRARPQAQGRRRRDAGSRRLRAVAGDRRRAARQGLRRRARRAAQRRACAAVPGRGGLRDRAGRGAGRRCAGDRLRRRRSARVRARRAAPACCSTSRRPRASQRRSSASSASTLDPELARENARRFGRERFRAEMADVIARAADARFGAADRPRRAP